MSGFQRSKAPPFSRLPAASGACGGSPDRAAARQYERQRCGHRHPPGTAVWLAAGDYKWAWASRNRECASPWRWAPGSGGDFRSLRLFDLGGDAADPEGLLDLVEGILAVALDLAGLGDVDELLGQLKQRKHPLGTL